MAKAVQSCPSEPPFSNLAAPLVQPGRSEPLVASIFPINISFSLAKDSGKIGPCLTEKIKKLFRLLKGYLIPLLFAPPGVAVGGSMQIENQGCIQYDIQTRGEIHTLFVGGSDPRGQTKVEWP